MSNQLISSPSDNDNQIIVPSQLDGLMSSARKQFDLAFGAFTKSVEHVWEMGKYLTEAKAEHANLKKTADKVQPIWGAILKQHGISISSDNRARRLFKNCPGLEQLSGLPIMKAYDLAGIKQTVPCHSQIENSDDDTEMAENQTETETSIVIHQHGPQSEPDDADGDDEQDEAQLDEDESDFDTHNWDDRRSQLVEYLADIYADIERLCTQHKEDDFLDVDVEEIVKTAEQIARCVTEFKVNIEERRLGPARFF